MHVASRLELALHLAVLAWVTVTTTSMSIRFSLSTIPIIVRAAGSAQLPTRLDHILDMPAAYIQQHHPHMIHWLPPRQQQPHGVESLLEAWAATPVLGVASAAQCVLHVLQLPRDVSDVQWREFRAGLPLLAAGMAVYVLLSRLVRGLLSSRGPAGERSVRGWAVTCLAASLGFLGVLHGAQAAWPVLLAGAHFALSHALAGRPWYGPAIVWSAHLALFVCIRATEGFAGMGARLSLQHLSWLDTSRGMLRWHIHHNFAMLRMLSYFMELHWSRLRQSALLNKAATAVAAGTGPTPTAVAAELKPGSLAPLSTHAVPLPAPPSLPPSTFTSPTLYLQYCLYPPLYIAGPIMPIHTWAAQALPRQALGAKVQGAGPQALGNGRSASAATGLFSSPSAWQVAAYALRWLGALLALELLTRTLHFNTLAKFRLLTRGLLQAQGLVVQPLHFAVTGFWVLVFMWLKFLVIWRFFRLVALADGFDPPENMRRCVCNNYDIQGFWQGWHASYNRWLVRYIYVPLGGNAWRWANIWVCFLFVALWHDLEWRMLAWGLLMPAAFVPELAIKAVGRSRAMAPYTDTAVYRHLSALLGAVNVVALMSANLVGFVVGPSGLAPLLSKALGRSWAEAAGMLGVLWCAVQLMFALRQHTGEWKRSSRDGAVTPDTPAHRPKQR